MINSNKNERDYVVFLDVNGDKIYDLEDVRREIEAQTDKIAGKK